MSNAELTKGSLPWELLEAAAPILRVLGHPVRLRIVETLMNQRLSVSALAAVIGYPQAAVSGHLAQLRGQRLVVCERDGRACFYRVAHPAVGFIIECLRRHGSDLERLGQVSVD
ncbi:ArsR/SmtB family transcription factor [Mucisphaera sp.]|uniref:ArsR/SmtB family transcription factor n=1 Tax=Mucisphaera sp. TaxID=2913024 RepID=UPI003D130FBA